MLLTKDILDVTEANVVKNDLLFFTAVMSKIDDVVSYTYGPKSGYVAKVDDKDRGVGFTYTKDGMATLNDLHFSRNAENDIVKMVSALGWEMKKRSGDGSTTAAKFLYNLVNTGANVILQDDEEYVHKLRINTPKAKELVIKEINNVFSLDYENHKNKGKGGIEDIVPAAFISLNNDESLLKPFNDLYEYLINNNIELDKSFTVMALQGVNDNTYIDTRPGFMLGTPRFILNPNKDKMERVKLIMLNLTVTHDMLKYIIIPIMDLAQMEAKDKDGNPLNVVFFVNDISDDTKVLMEQIYKEMITVNEDGSAKPLPRFEFISSRVIYSKLSRMEKDLSYLVDSDIINFDETFLEKRSKVEPLVNGNNVVYDDEIDNVDTTSLIKWKANFTRDTMGNITKKDYYYGYRKFKELFLKNIEKSKFVDIVRTEGSGLTLALSEGETTSELFNDYLNIIKEESRSEDPEVASQARERLHHLNDQLFIINVAKTKYDDDRLYTAYRDAAGSVTSIVKYGYHMGASVGLLEALREVEAELSFKIKFNIATEGRQMNDIEETAMFLIKILQKCTLELISTLLRDIKGKELYDDINHGDNYVDALRHEDIIPDKFLFDGIKVISPIESDLVMVKMVLNQFANIFSSLCIEYNDPMDVIYFTKITNDIKERLNYKNPIMKKQQEDVFFMKSEPVHKNTLDTIEEVKENVILPENNTIPKVTITKPEEIEPEKIEPIQNVRETNDMDGERRRREEEAKRKIEEIEHERLRKIMEYATEGPMNFVIPTDDINNIPGWYGHNLTGNKIDEILRKNENVVSNLKTDGEFLAQVIDDK